MSLNRRWVIIIAVVALVLVALTLMTLYPDPGPQRVG
jgi:hypothetical protein